MLAGLFRETPVKFFVRTDPKPEPVVIMAAGDGAVISGDAHRPRAIVKFQTLQLQTGMGRMIGKLLKGFLVGGADLRRQGVIQFPKIFRAA